MADKVIGTIEALVSAMATRAGESNAAAKDDEHKAGMCLIVFPDGSGVWCEATYAMKWYREQGTQEDLILHSKKGFKNPEEAAAIMAEELSDL
ncbi:hypothetical protein EON83_11150 [bacterium]|nr:MAG: hypothetical protein EON83_11150 [bacterium]